MMKGEREKLIIGGNASLRPGHSLLGGDGAAASSGRAKPKMDAAALLGSSDLLARAGAGGSAGGAKLNLLSRLDAFLPKMRKANTAVGFGHLAGWPCTPSLVSHLPSTKRHPPHATA